MKKTVLIIFAVFTSLYTSAQGFEGESILGFTVGDFKDALAWEIGGRVGYLWEVSPGFTLGPVIGFSWIFSKKKSGISIFDDSLGYTISAAGRIDLSEIVYFGTDLGYGGITAGSGTGGLYYRPLIGFKIGKRFSITASYAAINLKEGENLGVISVNNGDTLSTIQIGLRVTQ